MENVLVLPPPGQDIALLTREKTDWVNCPPRGGSDLDENVDSAGPHSSCW